MSGFASFLRQDLGAVTAELTLHWSSGVVEGHVNMVKTMAEPGGRNAAGAGAGLVL
ncbi:hypothetical protein [Streptomyces sp. NBC_00162]|uniref:hypothetical protein n=1 Tax=Streptomyces sp. NBC_00162 TaxID=2903629 RepID=UPI00214BC90F|nr:hypothetical protein [Streptomyces sp. NBC_00162]UUU44934.1 hypothetical protein JIW86_03685 [Streptomyces sp. NBC_00162]